MGEDVVARNRHLVTRYCDMNHPQNIITVSSHKRHGVSDRGELDCLFNSLFEIISTETSNANYNMTVWILARNDIGFSMAAGLIRLQMPGVK